MGRQARKQNPDHSYIVKMNDFNKTIFNYGISAEQFQNNLSNIIEEMPFDIDEYICLVKANQNLGFISRFILIRKLKNANSKITHKNK